MWIPKRPALAFEYEPAREGAPAIEDAAVVQAEQPDDAADLRSEDLQVADDDASEDADDHDSEDADDDAAEAADQEPGGSATCVNCHHGFCSSDPSEVINGRLYHRRDCAEYGRRIAIAAE